MFSPRGYAYAVASRPDDARRIREPLQEMTRTRLRLRLRLFAVVDAGLGETDSAFAHVDRAYAEGSDTMAILRVYPLLEPLRRDPRFEALMGKVEKR